MLHLDVDKVEALREKAGLTQQEAAERAGLTGRSHWNDIVKGRKTPTLETIQQIADALGVKAKDLLKE